MGGFYVYIHYRNDTGLPFYVGKGKGNRINSRESRNPHWHNIVNLCGYTARIIQDDLEEQDALALEKDKIQELRKVYGDGIINVCEGGDSYSIPHKTAPHKEEIKEFVARNGRFPSRTIPSEYPLWVFVMNYCTVTQCSYDPDFRAWAESQGYAQSSAQKKQAIRKFYEDTGDLPGKKDTLYKSLSGYCQKSCNAYDPEFHEWAKSVGYGSRKSIPGRFKSKRA